jgi:glycosyltransferase involved in cell wall biosynthesis
MESLVSILIPAYNAEQWLDETLHSATTQTWRRTEIIVVDDGSTDGTLAVARKYASRGVLVYSQPNAGAAAARNKAYSLCQGDFIQWLDADDLLAPEKIARQMSAAVRREGESILYSSAWARFYYCKRRALFCATSLWSNAKAVDWHVQRLKTHEYMSPACWLMSRKLAELAGPWDTRLSFDDDGEYFNRVVLASKELEFVPEARSYYRRSGYSSLSTFDRSDRKLDSLFLSTRLQAEQLRAAENSERVRVALRDHLQHFLICYFPERPDLVRANEKLAEEVGAGALAPPRFPEKYSWIGRASGNWRLAKQIMFSAPRLRDSFSRMCDRLFYCLHGNVVQTGQP